MPPPEKPDAHSGDNSPLIYHPDSQPNIVTNGLPADMQTSQPQAQPHEGRALRILIKIANIVLGIAIGLTILFIVFVSRAGTGSEIIFIAIGPLLVGIVFVITILKFILTLLRRRQLKRRGIVEPKSWKRKLSLALQGTLTVIGILFVTNLVLANRGRTPHVSQAKAITYISDCKVTFLQRDGLGDGNTVVINLNPDLPEATDRNGGINYFKANDSDWNSLVSAVKSAEPKCGRIGYEEDEKHTIHSTINYDQAASLLKECKISEVDKAATTSQRDMGNNSKISLTDGGSYKTMTAGSDTYDKLKILVYDNKSSIDKNCGNNQYGVADPFM